MEDGLLQSIKCPDDLRVLTFGELEELAAEIRMRLIEVTSRNGGHLAPSLGTVELILILHRLYDFAVDRLVFDVGHQSYAHKLITGRAESFDTLRMFEGICGFPRRDESCYDVHEAGHASDSLSIACGLAVARDLKGTGEDIVAFIGDAALSGGMAFEALNQIGHDQRNMTIILNDNEMSIARNVGALSHYLSKARVSRPYTTTRDTVTGGLSRIGKFGQFLVRTGDHAKSSFKKLFIPGMFFEDMGITYLGPIDGHNVAILSSVIERARDIQGPVLIHAVTQKGRGYAPAEQHPELFHGVGPFDAQTGELVARSNGKKSFSSVFSDALIAEAEKNHDIVAITAAMEDGTGLTTFKERFRERFFDVGIAEEHAVTLGAGLALGGKLPVVAIYSTFLQRSYDQIVTNVALPKQHVIFCVDRAGLVGEDGSTHHGAFDLAYMRSIPHMRIIAPVDESDFRDALHTAIQLQDGPVALRYPRDYVTPCDTGELAKVLPVGKAKLLREGNDVALLAVGRFVHVAGEVADILQAQGITALVYNMLWVKPLDEEAVARACKTKLIVTLEDGVIMGGFGSAILESRTLKASQGEAALQGNQSTPPILTLGLPDEFVAHGETQRLFDILGLTAPQIAETIYKALGNNSG